MTIIQTFAQLVSIDSPSGNEHQMGEFITQRLMQLGFTWKKDKLGSILASIPKSDPKFLLCAHMDTVEPGRKIQCRSENGYLKSDGTTILGADNKASIATILEAIEAYKFIHNHLPPIELLFTVKEETGGGIDHFPMHWVHAKKAIIFDYARPLGKIILSSPFIINFAITITGKAAHASTPEKGENALVQALNLLQKIPMGTVATNTTINIGRFESGTGVNTIPNSAIIRGEVRSYSQQLFEQQLELIKNATNTPHASYSTSGFCPGYTHPKDHQNIQACKKILHQCHLRPVCENSKSVSDANILNQAGIMTITLSDGVENPHTVQERIKISNLEKLQQIISMFLIKY